MGDEIDNEIIKSTQNSLGKYVKRPPLSEKLLRKPPFRFIHDIITTVLKTTGFFNGLFDEKELVSDNVKDRESKIQFLNKIIDVLENTTGKSLLVKPSKVIAGQEPEKTNELLQCLAQALDNNLSSDGAVKKYKESLTKQTNIDNKSKENKKTIKRNSDAKLSTKNVVKTEPNVVKSKHKELQKKESPPKKSLHSSRSTSKKNSENIKKEDNVSKKSFVSSDSPNSSDVDKTLTKIDNDNSQALPDTSISSVANNDDLGTEKEDEKVISIFPEPLLAVGSLQPEDALLNEQSEHKDVKAKEEDIIQNKDNYIKNNHKTEYEDIVNKESKVDIISDNNLQQNINTTPKKTILKEISKENSVESVSNENRVPNGQIKSRPLSVRPSSSRPGAPRLREKHEESIVESDNLLIGKVNIIAENTVQEEDEESSIVIIENEEISKTQTAKDLEQLNYNEHGHLVQQILESQQEFSQVVGKTEVEWQLGAKKARDIIHQEIDQLRFNLQALSRVANPLGKLLDHIQEDVEVMRQELQYWTKTYDNARKELLKQNKDNKEKLQPLYSKIKLLSVEITEKEEKINDLKMTIHKNASRIDKLLANGNRQ